MHVRGDRGGSVATGEAIETGREILGRFDTEPAELRRQRRAQHAALAERLDVLERERAFTVVLVGRVRRIGRVRLAQTRRSAGPTSVAGRMPKSMPSPEGKTSEGSVRSDLLDHDVDAGGKVEALERVDGLAGGLDDVDQALVDAHLEVLAAVLVDVRRADDRVLADLGRQRHRAAHLRLRAQDRLDDLLRRLVDDLVVIRLQADADLLTCGVAAM